MLKTLELGCKRCGWQRAESKSLHWWCPECRGCLESLSGPCKCPECEDERKQTGLIALSLTGVRNWAFRAKPSGPCSIRFWSPIWATVFWQIEIKPTSGLKKILLRRWTRESSLKN